MIRSLPKARGTEERIHKRQFFSILLVFSIQFVLVISISLVSDPGSVSPFFLDELLAPVLHFVYADRGEKGFGGKRVVP